MFWDVEEAVYTFKLELFDKIYKLVQTWIYGEYFFFNNQMKTIKKSLTIIMNLKYAKFDIITSLTH